MDTLIIGAVKEMIVNDSKQSAVLRHELSVFQPQLQPLDIRSRGVTRGNSYRRTRAATSRNLPLSPSSTAAANAPAGRAPRARRPRGGSDSFDGTTGSGDGNRNSSGGDQARRRERRPPCPYMPRYFGSFVSQDASGRPSVSIVLEHIAGVDLERWIQESGPEHSPPPELWLACVCRDLVKALRYLHERRRIHRDVKPANVLLTPCGAKLADFGSTVEEEEGEGHRMHGTIRFMSPERLEARQYRPSSDLWAAGLTIAVAALGENPIPHCSEFDAVVHAMAAFDMVAAHPRASQLSPELLDFLRFVLVPEPDKRPTAEQMLDHPFVRQAVVGCGSSNIVGDGSGSGNGNCSRGGCGGGDEFLGFRRGGFGLGLDGRRRRTERACAQEEKDEKAHAVGGGSRSNSFRVSACCCGSSNGTSCGCRGKCGAGAGEAGSQNGGEEWREAVKQRLQSLRRKYVSPVEASDVVRKILAARRTRWGHSEGSSRAGLEKLDFSHLAVELDMTTAGLRSLFGTVATNMDGGINTGSWSSPAPSTGSSLTSRSSSRDAETERDRPQLGPMPSPSPLPLPSRAHPPRSPLPRRRPPPLIVSPAPMPLAREMILQSVPTSPAVDDGVASIVRRSMSAVLVRAWPGRHRRHTAPETLRGAVVPGLEENSDEEGTEGEGDAERARRFSTRRARSGIAWGRDNASAGRGGWFRRRGFRLRRMFKSSKNSRVTIVVEPGTTEVPSPPRPDEMSDMGGNPMVSGSTRYRHDDGVRRGEGESGAGMGAVTAVERCGAYVDHGLGRVADVAGQRSIEATLLGEAMTGGCDRPAPVWTLGR